MISSGDVTLVADPLHVVLHAAHMLNITGTMVLHGVYLMVSEILALDIASCCHQLKPQNNKLRLII